MTSNYLNKTLIFLVFTFPLIFIFRSVAINIYNILISLLVIFFLFKNQYKFYYNSKIIFYFGLFFLFIVVNSVINFQSYEVVIKAIGNYRYLLLSIGVFIVLKKYFIILTYFL